MKYINVAFLLFILFGCENDEVERNPYLPVARFSFEIDLNLPLYSNLQFPNNAVYVGTAGVGIRGIFVINIGNNQFLAYEASCPNQVPSQCSTLRLDGTNVVCPCDDLEYSLSGNGQLWNAPDDDGIYYPLLPYRAVFRGNSVIVSN